MKRKILSVILALAMALSLLPATALPAAAAEPDKWDGSIANSELTTGYGDSSKKEFTISSAAQLAELAKLVNEGKNFAGRTVTLTVDLDLDNKEWTPIGSSSSRESFNGTFDGQNHTIKGLSVTVNSNSMGLFGYVHFGTVRNLTVKGEIVCNAGGGPSDYYVGGIVAYNREGRVINCSYDGSVTDNRGSSRIGGVVGFNDRNSVVEGCSNYATVSGTGNRGVGGIVGCNDNSVIIRCKNEGPVEGASYIGGIVGMNNYSAETPAKVKNCFNTGAVSAKSGSTLSYAGGVVGYNSGGSAVVENCHNVGKVDNGSNVGAVVGCNSDVSEVKNCYYNKDFSNVSKGVGSGQYEGNREHRAEPRSDAEFKSGAITWLLQHPEEVDPSYSKQADRVWGQRLVDPKDLHPVFIEGDGTNEIYRVKFVYGGEWLEKEDRYANKDQQIDLPKGPVNNPAYDHTNWYEEPNFSGTAYPSSGKYTVKKDITLYSGPDNVAYKYSVTYLEKDGTTPVNVGEEFKTYYTDKGLILPTGEKVPPKDHYTFIGWHEQPDLSDKPPVTEIKAGNPGSPKTFYAEREAIEYTVTYHLNGGTIKDVDVVNDTYTQTYYYGVGVTQLPTPTKGNSTFDGWYTEEGFTNKVKEISATDPKNMDLYAKWIDNSGGDVTPKPVIGEVEYVTYGGKIANEANYKSYDVSQGMTLPTANEVTRDGYTFKGWYTESDFREGSGPETKIDPVVDPSDPVAPKTFYAKWTPIDYTVTYVVNGGAIETTGDVKEGTENDTYTQTFTVVTGVKPLPEPTRTRYKFKGWYTTSDFAEGSKVEEIAANVPGHKRLYAKWEGEEYKIKYLEATDDTPVNGIAESYKTYTFGTYKPLPSNVTNSNGIELDGWYRKKDFTDEGGEVGGILETEFGDQTFYAKWKDSGSEDPPPPPGPEYSITYYIDNIPISFDGFEKYREGDRLTLPVPPTRSGYTFNGWYANRDFTGGKVTEIVPTDTGDKTFYATWTENAGGGVGPGSSTPPTGGDDSGSGSGSDSDDGPATYPPKITDTDHGSTSVSPRAPEAGDDVTIFPKPDDGYEVGRVEVKDSRGNNLKVTDNGDGTYEFEQPNNRVTVTVTFVPREDGSYYPGRGYYDLDPNAWYWEAVNYVLRNGLMSGYGDGRFAPNEYLTRAMTAQILYEHAGAVPVNYLLQYDDVSDGAWYAEAVRWATSVGVASGYGSYYKPDALITREELASMLYRYAKIRGGGFTGAWMFQLDYADAGEISDYAYEGTAWCVMNRILSGYEDHTLRPKGYATRAEAAVMLMYFCERK